MAHDTYISYHSSKHDLEPMGVILIDPGLHVCATGRYLHISTHTRRLLTFAPTERVAREWEKSLREFYNSTARSRSDHPFQSSYPVRSGRERIRIHCLSHDYYLSLARALLSASYDIFIAARQHHPHVLLTRPPLPPVRLDEIIKYKAEQGVRVYILLHRDVSINNDVKGPFRLLWFPGERGSLPVLPEILQPNGTWCQMCALS